MIIDIHTHVFPDELAPRAIEVLSHNAGTPPYTDGTCAGLSASTRFAGIDYAMVAPIATKPSQVRGINRWASGIHKQYDNLLSLGTLHPAQEDWQEEIAQLAADGFRGIKLHPEYQQFFVDNEGFMRIARALADAGLAILFHAGVDIGLPPPVHCTPDRLARLLDAVPTLTVIAAHMGGYACWDDVERYLIGRSLFLDTSYSLGDLGVERMVAMIRAHGVERVLFGTDSPWTEQSSEVAAIQSLPLSTEEISAILGGNASKLLGISA